MSDFDYKRYCYENPDIMQAYGPDIYITDLYLHYLNFGAAEGRVAYSTRTGQPFILEPNAQQAYQDQLKLTSSSTRLANVTLTPEYDWPEPLRSVAEQVLTQVGGSTPYEQLRGCYDWLIQNCSYGRGKDIPMGPLQELGPSGWLAREAYSILVGREGVCFGYSAAFVVLARMIGFDAVMQHGQTHKATGGYTGHAWCVINIHGVDYVFDPQVEDNIAKGGTIQYLRFCKTYEEVPDKYIVPADFTVPDMLMDNTDLA